MPRCTPAVTNVATSRYCSCDPVASQIDWKVCTVDLVAKDRANKAKML